MNGPGNTNGDDEEEDEFAKLLRLANEASLAGNQDLANELIDKLLDNKKEDKENA